MPDDRVTSFICERIEREEQRAVQCTYDGGCCLTCNCGCPDSGIAKLDAAEMRRRILHEHRPENDRHNGDPVCGTCMYRYTITITEPGAPERVLEEAGQPQRWPCPTVRLLAWEYRDDPEWDAVEWHVPDQAISGEPVACLETHRTEGGRTVELWSARLNPADQLRQFHRRRQGDGEP